MASPFRASFKIFLSILTTTGCLEIIFLASAIDFFWLFFQNSVSSEYTIKCRISVLRHGLSFLIWTVDLIEKWFLYLGHYKNSTDNRGTIHFSESCSMLGVGNVFIQLKYVSHINDPTCPWYFWLSCSYYYVLIYWKHHEGVNGATFKW